MSDIEIKLNVSKFKKNLLAHLEKNMYRVVVELVAYIKASFGPSNLGGSNPSKPGQTPNIGLGTLRNSISFTVSRNSTEVIGRFGVIKGPASVYAMALEYGYSPHNLSERPYIRPAYFNNKRKIIRILSS